MKRWLLLENEPALRSGDFFPPEDVWPELAHLRKEHERLLAVVGTEQRAYTELRERYEAEDAQRSENLKAACLLMTAEAPSRLGCGQAAPDARGTGRAG
jgi:hypothetical protein